MKNIVSFRFYGFLVCPDIDFLGQLL